MRGSPAARLSLRTPCPPTGYHSRFERATTFNRVAEWWHPRNWIGITWRRELKLAICRCQANRQRTRRTLSGDYFYHPARKLEIAFRLWSFSVAPAEASISTKLRFLRVTVLLPWRSHISARRLCPRGFTTSRSNISRQLLVGLRLNQS